MVVVGSRLAAGVPSGRCSNATSASSSCNGSRACATASGASADCGISRGDTDETSISTEGLPTKPAPKPARRQRPGTATRFTSVRRPPRCWASTANELRPKSSSSATPLPFSKTLRATTSPGTKSTSSPAWYQTGSADWFATGVWNLDGLPSSSHTQYVSGLPDFFWSAPTRSLALTTKMRRVPAGASPHSQEPDRSSVAASSLLDRRPFTDAALPSSSSMSSRVSFWSGSSCFEPLRGSREPPADASVDSVSSWLEPLRGSRDAFADARVESALRARSCFANNPQDAAAAQTPAVLPPRESLGLRGALASDAALSSEISDVIKSNCGRSTGRPCCPVAAEACCTSGATSFSD
mmetsp:Transcript_46428/g.129191  ORF Transcript_46428/g.129191 Transcript_46428/m.129191 type:complete len:353 (+) Transcript_46428:642-1700(+)